METAKELADRFREVFLHGTWIANTNYQDQLNKVNRVEAIKSLDNLNSIAALTFHIHYYLEGVFQVLEGGPLSIRDQYSFDMPPLQTEEDWEKLRQKLLVQAEKIASRIEMLSQPELEQVFVDPKYGSYRRNLEALIEHAYYHLGQISLIRKLLKERSA
ncbi:MAG: DinB family protein [Bacteroidetes bacterium]|nr:MAG: DinB family protein [Bacteroidota bacterium]